jgi:hypothetical protein
MTDERDPSTFHILFGHVAHKCHYSKVSTIRRDIWVNWDVMGRSWQHILATENNQSLRDYKQTHKKYAQNGYCKNLQVGLDFCTFASDVPS